MSKIRKCLNEWNATVEALGTGKQTILIRKYGTSLDKFLLYPTLNYSKKEDYFTYFKKDYLQFIKNNTLPKIEGKKTEIKYLAKVVNVLKKNPTQISSFNNYHIWTNKHVKSYLGREKGNIWILRIFKLEKPQMVKKNPGIMYANLKEELSLEGIEPVLSDSEFSKIVQEIENK